MITSRVDKAAAVVIVAVVSRHCNITLSCDEKLFHYLMFSRGLWDLRLLRFGFPNCSCESQ